eukprot:4828728-Pyramimonas_sp.AAC.1
MSPTLHCVERSCRAVYRRSQTECALEEVDFPLLTRMSGRLGLEARLVPVVSVAAPTPDEHMQPSVGVRLEPAKGTR